MAMQGDSDEEQLPSIYLSLSFWLTQQVTM